MANPAASSAWIAAGGRSNGKLYFPSETGETTIVEASPQFDVLARNRAQASFAASRGQLLIRTREHLYSIGRVSP
jgi:hypothetical protein